jgi:hypothetical protein
MKKTFRMAIMVMLLLSGIPSVVFSSTIHTWEIDSIEGLWSYTSVVPDDGLSLDAGSYEIRIQNTGEANFPFFRIDIHDQDNFLISDVTFDDSGTGSYVLPFELNDSSIIDIQFFTYVFPGETAQLTGQLNSVPLPASMFLLGSGLFALTVLRKRNI